MCENIFAVKSHGIWLTNDEARNETVLNEPINIQCNYFASDIISNKYINGNVIQLRQRRMELQMSCGQLIFHDSLTINTNYENYSQPRIVNGLSHFPTPLNVHPCTPLMIQPGNPILVPHVAPIVELVLQPLIPPVSNIFNEDVANTSCNKVYNHSTDHFERNAGISNGLTYIVVEDLPTTIDTLTEDSNLNNIDIKIEDNQIVDLESYLKLPKEKFPKPNKLPFDPNAIIDVICKMPNKHYHLPWLLDLEFGIPKHPVKRPISLYNVILNNIFCKNAPNEIHPDFESCDETFKSTILFYYDYVVSAWYRGYAAMYGDESVENFQSWLLLPMQVLGMSWS